MSLLDSIDSPSTLRGLGENELQRVADEIRAFVIESVSATGGHFASGLGGVELTVALHYVFDTLDDRLVWDVGHQSYPHKILTGHKAAMSSVRKVGGMAGFPAREAFAHAQRHTDSRRDRRAGMACAELIVRRLLCHDLNDVRTHARLCVAQHCEQSRNVVSVYRPDVVQTQCLE